jgi:CNT family concentrative nucleoside transporter
MVSLIGVALMLFIAFVFSSHKKAINWRTVGGAFAIQASVGALVLYFPPGKEFLLTLTIYVQNIINYSQDGINFIFGPMGDKSMGFIFAFNVLPVIVFFSSLISVLYHLKIMNLIIRTIGGFLQFFLKSLIPQKKTK